MNAATGIAFGRERVYCVCVSRTDDAVRVHAASAVVPEPGASAGAASFVARMGSALRAMFASLPVPCTRVAVALPISWTFTHTFPAAAGASASVLQERSAWELARHLAPESVDAYASTVFSLAHAPTSYLSIAYPKPLLGRLHELFGALGVSLVAAVAEPLAAVRALRQCYADAGDATTALVACGGLDGAVTIVRGGRIAAFREHAELSTVTDLVSGVEQLEAFAGGHALETMVYGELLSKELLDAVAARKQLHAVHRFNAFRGTVPAELSPRMIAYCRRTAHLFPAAMGAALEAIDRGERTDGAR